LALLDKITADVSAAINLPRSRLPLVNTIRTKKGRRSKGLNGLYITATYRLGYVINKLLGGALYTNITEDKGINLLIYVIWGPRIIVLLPL